MGGFFSGDTEGVGVVGQYPVEMFAIVLQLCGLGHDIGAMLL
jgi:hypothetical protein